MVIHFKIIGALLMVLAFIHVFFPKYFHWKEELKALSLMNRQMMQVHAFFIAFVVFLMGALCYGYSEELIHTELGKTITWGLAIFWVVRLIFQLFVYSPKLWKGKPMETSIHLVFIFLWVYFSSVFLWTVIA